MSVQTIFNHPTVAELAKTIEKDRQPDQNDLEKLAQMLEFVEQLSEDEAKELV